MLPERILNIRTDPSYPWFKSLNDHTFAIRIMASVLELTHKTSPARA